MTGQYDFGFMATGQAAANLLPADVRRRLVQNHLRGREFFYAMGREGEQVLVWAGRGQRPRWVQQWLDDGGKLEQLAARVDLLEKTA